MSLGNQLTVAEFSSVEEISHSYTGWNFSESEGGYWRGKCSSKYVDKVVNDLAQELHARDVSA